MDLLSAVSSVITLLAAGGTIVHGLERLSSLREAPNTVLALNNEVSDFRVAISELLSMLQHEPQRLSTSPTFNDNLDSVLRRARDKLVELEYLIEYKLLAPNSGSEIRLSKTAWILERHKVKRIQEELRSIRINMITMLGIFNSKSISRLQLQLTDISLVGTEMQNQLGRASSMVGANFRLIGTQLAQIESHSHTESRLRDRSSGRLRQHPAPPASSQQGQGRAATIIGDSVLPGLDSSHGIPTLFISSGIRRHQLICLPTCTCHCHDVRSWKSPRWLQPLLGLLFTGYAGMPFMSPSCNDTLCQHRSEPTATIKYYFPPWFASQVLQVYIQLSNHNGIKQSLRTYRVVWNGSEIFRKTDAGDVEGVKAVLASRQGSPFDISDVGGSALAVSAIASNL